MWARLITIFAAPLTSLLFLSCGQGGLQLGFPNTGGMVDKNVVVRITTTGSPGTFSPNSVTVDQGAQISWANQGTEAHTVTSISNLWDSGILQPGQSFGRTFSTPGTYDYICRLHPQEAGAIIVNSSVPTPNPTATVTPVPIPTVSPASGIPGTATSSGTGTAAGSATATGTATATGSGTAAGVPIPYNGGSFVGTPGLPGP